MPPPAPCDVFAGDYAFETDVTESRSPSWARVHGQYLVELHPDCGFELKKTGYKGDQNVQYRDDQVQRTKGRFVGTAEPTLRGTFDLALASQSGFNLSIQMTLAFDSSGRVTGTWRYLGKDWVELGLAGTLTGAITRPRAAPGQREISELATATASSTLLPDPGMTFEPSNLLDGRFDTSWQPLAKGTRGVSEWFTLRFAEPHAISRVDVANGYQYRWQGQDLFPMNARLREAEIKTGSHTQRFVFPADQRGYVEIAIEPPVVASVITVKAVSVHQGARWPDLAVSDVRVFAVDPTKEEPAQHEELAGDAGGDLCADALGNVHRVAAASTDEDFKKMALDPSSLEILRTMCRSEKDGPKRAMFECIAKATTDTAMKGCDNKATPGTDAGHE